MIKGHRKYISRENGKLTLDVQNSNLKNIGKATDVIKYIPGMLYTNGKYEVFGKGEPVIYIDGRKQTNTSGLSLLSSTNVKSVQLITNPGAEYDAETRSVINITTVHHSLDGLSGIVGAEISKHKNLSNNEEVNLNIHKGALDMFLAYQYDNTRSDIRYDVNQFNYEQDTFHEISASEYSDRSHSHDYNVGMNYAINKNHTIGGKYLGSISNYKMLDSPFDYMQTYKNDELLTSTDNKTEESEKERFHNVNLYYIGKLTDNLQLNLDVDYVYAQLKHKQQVSETSRIDAVSEITHMQNNQRNRATALKGVFAWNMNKNNRLDFGTDFSKISSWGMSVNEEGKIADDQFKNKETKYAGFATFRLSASKWKGSIGLRYEYIHAINTDQGEVKNKTNYSDLLPSLSLPLCLGEWG
ncbi:MAG: outer membrane beta-barrel protein [Segatella copri]